MPLLGKAAMCLSFDVSEEAIPEHDDWHTHEHLPERLSIPGFLRGTRWVAQRGQPRYFVMYEVASLETLVSAAYVQRLNNPTPWTSKIMPSYRGMARGLCSVVASCGVGMGHYGLLIRFDVASGSKEDLTRWLVEDVLPRLPTQPGLGSVHLLEIGVAAPMTNEQRIRGADAGFGWALLTTGYSLAGLDALAETTLAKASLEAHGAKDAVHAIYQNAYTVTAQEIDA